MKASQGTVLQRASEILELERQSLLIGDFDALSDLVPRKEAIFESLADLGADAGPDIASLRGRAKANQLLLDSAAEGLKDVAARLRQMKEVQEKLRTYDSQGSVGDYLAPRKRQLERRA